MWIRSIKDRNGQLEKRRIWADEVSPVATMFRMNEAICEITVRLATGTSITYIPENQEES